ncbi:MAG: hypothetical protein Kow0068_15790 [Marinilabiliales bacterium]
MKWNNHLLKNILLFALLAFFITNVTAQDPDKEAATNFEDENYRVALKQYLKLLKTDPKNVEYQYRIGVCYLNTNVDKSEALPYLIFADSLNYWEENIKYLLAQAYFYNEKFDTAIKYFQKYKESIKDEITTEIIREINHYIEQCKIAKQMKETPVNVSFYNLGTNINSRRSDFNPHVTPDGSFMVYSSNKKYIRDFQQYVINCYYSLPAQSDFGEWSKSMSFGSKVNTEENETVVGLAHDKSYAIIMLDNLSADHDLGISKIRNNRFKEVEILGKEVNSKYYEEGACFTITGDTLIFASNRPGGKGGFDLYLTYKIDDERWRIPINLSDINTEYDDNFPEILPDGKHLQFASKGHNSMGGYDIFRAKWDKSSGTFKDPVNLGYPINDTYDNTNISMTKSGRYGYISKWRKEGIGDLDIYKVIFNDVPPIKIKYQGKILVGDSLNFKTIDQISSNIKMKVLEKRTGEVVADITDLAVTGKYEFELTPGIYDLVIKGEAYDLYHDIIVIYDIEPAITNYKSNIYLKPKSSE